MNNFKIAVKLAFGFGLLLLLFAFSVCFGWMHIYDVQQDSQLLAGGVSEAMLLASEIEHSENNLLFAMRGFQYLENESDLPAIRQMGAQLRDQIAQGKKLLQADPRLEPMKDVLGMEPIFADYLKNIEEAARLTEAKRKSIDQLNLDGIAIQKSLAELIDLQYAEAKIELENGGVTLLDRRLKNIHLSEQLLFRITELRRIYFAAQFRRNVKGMQELLGIIDKIHEDCEALFAGSFRPLILEKLGQNLLELDAYRTTLVRLIDEYVALTNVHNARNPLREALDKRANSMSQATRQWMKTASQEAVEELDDSVMMLVSSTILAVIAGLLIAFLISRSITKPMKTIVELTDRAKDGDLTIVKQDFCYKGHDELGRLVDSLSDMIAAQRNAVREVVMIVDDVARSADILSSVAVKGDTSVRETRNAVVGVAALCESNSAALEECNAGIEEMSAGAMTAAQSSTDCAEFISQTTTVSDSAVGTVKDAIKDIGTLHVKSQQSEKKIRDLVNSVGQISEFVTVITSIANQTNLLALNAAIEAARAGEAGRGFAVVAEEVRKLAEDSGRAAKNVESLISSLQNSAREAITATTESAEIVQSTLHKAAAARDSLDEAMTQIDKANDSIQNIAAVAQEQAASSREVAAGIDQATQSTMEIVQNIEMIRQSAEDTSNVTSDIASQAEEMNELGIKLKDALSGFKVEIKEESNRLALK